MKTNAAELFQRIIDPATGRYDPIRPGALFAGGYDSFFSTLRSTSETKLRSRLRHPDALWSVPAIGLILADILLLTGWEDDDALEARPTTEPVPRDVAEINILGVEERSGFQYGDVGHHQAVLPAFAMFPSTLLASWAKDAEPFIRDGRLIYLPQRVLIALDGVPENTTITDVPLESPWALWQTVKASHDEGSQALVPQGHGEAMLPGFLEVFCAAMPFIDGVSLPLLHKVMGDEEASLVAFRKALGMAIKEYTKAASPDDAGAASKLGTTIRRDLVDPELARLSLTFRRVVETRSLKVAGAALGTIGLLAAAISSGGLAAAIAAALGAGGGGVLARELAEFRSDILGMKDNPWYFAWQLKRLATS